MRISLRITQPMLGRVRLDLRRSHPHAAERVGFVFCRFGLSERDELLVLAYDYAPVLDSDYIPDQTLGALIGAGAFRSALERTLSEAVGVFHIHMHQHPGSPCPSATDRRESARFVPDFFHIRRNLPHGALIVSHDTLSGHLWLEESGRPIRISTVAVVGTSSTIARRCT